MVAHTSATAVVDALKNCWTLPPISIRHVKPTVNAHRRPPKLDFDSDQEFFFFFCFSSVTEQYHFFFCIVMLGS